MTRIVLCRIAASCSHVPTVGDRECNGAAAQNWAIVTEGSSTVRREKLGPGSQGEPRQRSLILLSAVRYSHPGRCRLYRGFDTPLGRTHDPDRVTGGVLMGYAGALFRMIQDVCAGGVCFNSENDPSLFDDQCFWQHGYDMQRKWSQRVTVADPDWTTTLDRKGDILLSSLPHEWGSLHKVNGELGFIRNLSGLTHSTTGGRGLTNPGILHYDSYHPSLEVLQRDYEQMRAGAPMTSPRSSCCLDSTSAYMRCRCCVPSILPDKVTRAGLQLHLFVACRGMKAGPANCRVRRPAQHKVIVHSPPKTGTSAIARFLHDHLGYRLSGWGGENTSIKQWRSTIDAANRLASSFETSRYASNATLERLKGIKQATRRFDAFHDSPFGHVVDQDLQRGLDIRLKAELWPHSLFIWSDRPIKDAAVSWFRWRHGGERGTTDWQLVPPLQAQREINHTRRLILSEREQMMRFARKHRERVLILHWRGPAAREPWDVQITRFLLGKKCVEAHRNKLKDTPARGFKMLT